MVSRTSTVDVPSYLLGLFTAAVVSLLLGAGTLLYMESPRRPQPTLVTPGANWEDLVESDTDLGWWIAPDLDHVHETRAGDSKCLVRTNRLGLRGDALHENPASRLLALGDSCTFGLDVDQTESWPAQLQAILDPDRSRIEILNAGCPAATSFQGFRYLHTRGLKLEPDLVIFTFGYNDRCFTRLEDMGWIGETHHALLEEIGLGDLVTLESDLGKTQRRLSAGQFHDVLTWAALLCRSESIPLVFGIWYARNELDRDLRTDGYQDIIRNVAAREDVPVLDFRSVLATNSDSIYMDSVHLNATGYRLVAEEATRYLREHFSEVLAETPDKSQQ